MRRYRRLVVIDRIIPFLAAVVGLVALAGAVAVQINTDSKMAATNTTLSELRSSIDALGQRTTALTPTVSDGTAEALLALQERMDKVQGEWDAQKTALAATPASAPAAVTSPTTAEVDPSLPTVDCIPLGTRFMVLPDDSYPICQSKAVVKTGAITADTIYFDGAGAVVETGFGSLPGTSCTVMVFQADEAGFGEVRVTCT